MMGKCLHSTIEENEEKQQKAMGAENVAGHSGMDFKKLATV